VTETSISSQQFPLMQHTNFQTTILQAYMLIPIK